MRRFASYDGTELGYRVVGEGPPLICLPGGPGRAAEYLGDLGGLATTRQLILLDPRGVGSSADPADPATFRADRLVRDVEALREHLGLERIDLLAHSAGAVLGTLYAVAHPHRLSHLALITPGLGALDIHGTEEDFTAIVERFADEPWYPAARGALEKITAGDLSMEAFRVSRLLFYGSWTEAAQAHATLGMAPRHLAARLGYFADLPLDPSANKSALTQLTAPVLLYAGNRDAVVPPATVHQAAALFHDALVIVQPEAGHYPWIDDPAAFAAALEAFLR
jgi:pimeloyl-ACP methyl ester carboxylesterase